MTSAPRSELQRAADDNLVRAFQRLVPYSAFASAGTAAFGGAVAVVTGSPSAFFNPITAVDDALTESDLRDALAFVQARGVRPSVQVRVDLESAVEPVFGDLGYRRDAWLTPGMALDPLPEHSPPAPPELAIETVVDEAGLERWFGASPAMRPFIPRGFAFDPDVRLVVGSVDDVPVTTALVFHSDGVLGIYAVGTAESARRRGYGAAITGAAIEAGRAAWGGLPAILQSSEMGSGIYGSMGFREICHYAIWLPPTRTEPAGPGASAGS
jgi:GNAT superfamily N-acetyltransferase